MTYSTQFQTAPMEGRFAWCYLGARRTTDMDNKPLEKPRYECGFYFPKLGADRNADRNWLFFYSLLQEVVNAAYRGQWPAIDPRGEWKDFPIEDCDFPAYVEKYPWARGMWRVRLSGGNFAPRIFDLGNNLLTPDVDGKYRVDQFKGDDNSGGDWGMVSVNAYEWSYGASRKGVSFGVEGIKVTRHDEKIGGAAGRPVEQMFGAPTGQSVAGGAPLVAPPPLPGSPVPPTQGYGALQYAPAPGAHAPYTAPGGTSAVATAPSYLGPGQGPGSAPPYPSNPPQGYGPPPIVPGAQTPYPGGPPGMPPVPPQFGQR